MGLGGYFVLGVGVMGSGDGSFWWLFCFGCGGL